jgi:hypothetical protein
MGFNIELRVAITQEGPLTDTNIGQGEVIAPGPLEGIQAKGGKAVKSAAVLSLGAEEPLEEGEAERGKAPGAQRLHLCTQHRQATSSHIASIGVAKTLLSEAEQQMEYFLPRQRLHRPHLLASMESAGDFQID